MYLWNEMRGITGDIWGGNMFRSKGTTTLWEGERRSYWENIHKKRRNFYIIELHIHVEGKKIKKKLKTAWEDPS